jgi:hypothetical protein
MSNSAAKKPVVVCAGPTRIKRFTFRMGCPGGHLDGEEFMVDATSEELAMQKATEYCINLSHRIGVSLVETTETVQFASQPYAARVKW